jgi:DNA-binding GntR family transcriptional regulator
VIYAVRLVVEPFLTERAASRISPAEIGHFDRLNQDFLARLSVAPDDLTLLDLVALDAEVHMTIYRAADSYLEAIVMSYWSRLQRGLALRVYRARPPLRFGEQHISLFHALASGDAVTAGDIMRQHLAESAAAILDDYALGERQATAE